MQSPSLPAQLLKFLSCILFSLINSLQNIDSNNWYNSGRCKRAMSSNHKNNISVFIPNANLIERIKRIKWWHSKHSFQQQLQHRPVILGGQERQIVINTAKENTVQKQAYIAKKLVYFDGVLKQKQRTTTKINRKNTQDLSFLMWFYYKSKWEAWAFCKSWINLASWTWSEDQLIERYNAPVVYISLGVPKEYTRQLN